APVPSLAVPKRDTRWVESDPARLATAEGATRRGSCRLQRFAFRSARPPLSIQNGPASRCLRGVRCRQPEERWKADRTPLQNQRPSRASFSHEIKQKKEVNHKKGDPACRGSRSCGVPPLSPSNLSSDVENPGWSRGSDSEFLSSTPT